MKDVRIGNDTETPDEDLECDDPKRQDFRRKNIKYGTQKKSLLNINKTPSQKRNSRTFSDSFQVTDEEHLITYLPGPRKIFTVLWHNDNDQITHEIVDTFSVNFKIDDLINQVIILFNRKFQASDYNARFIIQKDGYDLFMAKKKNGKPNMEFPSFDKRCSLSETQLQTFALYARSDVCSMICPTYDTIEEKYTSSSKTSKNDLTRELLPKQEPTGQKNLVYRMFCFCFDEE